jgi:hypothetical protein
MLQGRPRRAKDHYRSSGFKPGLARTHLFSIVDGAPQPKGMQINAHGGLVKERLGSRTLRCDRIDRLCSRPVAELGMVQPGVQAMPLQQIGMRALFDQSSAFHHQNNVG